MRTPVKRALPKPSEILARLSVASLISVIAVGASMPLLDVTTSSAAGFTLRELADARGMDIGAAVKRDMMTATECPSDPEGSHHNRCDPL